MIKYHKYTISNQCTKSIIENIIHFKNTKLQYILNYFNKKRYKKAKRNNFVDSFNLSE